MAERYWEARWRDEKAHNEALIEALMSARRRIDYLGAVCGDPKHFVANDKTFFPKIDAALEWMPDSNGDRNNG
jgi:hypothetical protein